jgi:hemerythrin-like domain-containing protein
MTPPTAQLVAEHDRILVLLDVLDRLTEATEAADLPADAPLDDIARAIEAVRDYADGCHHGKEEALLFPAMEAAGVPRQGGPIGCMLSEHEQGRASVADMADALGDLRAGDASAAEAFATAATDYVNLLRHHIHKENQVLFPMGESVLSDEERARLLEAFAKVESDEVGIDRLRALEAQIDGLAETWLGRQPA